MKDEVIAFWDPSPNAPTRQAELAALWVRSWKAQGWKPRIYLPGKEKLSRRGKGVTICVEFWKINFSFKPGGNGHMIRVDEPGWESAEIVNFGCNVSPDFVLQCFPKG